MLDSKGKIHQEDFSLGSQKIDYTFLTPGNYTLKVIIDSNNNNKWDTGNYSEKTQAETIVIYEKPIVIRANWDNEIKWKLK